MLTRSKARALVADNTTVIVSPSATGQGTHTRWQYPAGRPSSSSSSSGSGSGSTSSSRTASTGSLSSQSTLSDSSLSSISDASFHTAFSQPQTQIQPQIQPPVTPAAPSSPRKLQRSPAARRYVYGSTHIIQEAPPDEPPMGDSLMERRLEEVFQREWDILMKSRQIAMQAHQGYETDDESDAMDTDSEGYTRGDTEPVEVPPPKAGPSRRPRPLGPFGTEIIDHETFTPESSALPIYPQKWVSSRKSLKWQPTEQFND